MSAPRKVILIPFIRRVFGRAPPLSPWDSPKPVREELFSLERLEEHARSLALAQRVAPKPIKGYSLAGRLADNAAVLLDAYRVNAKAIDEGRTITPAAEWLIDNYHLVEKQIREIRSDLPPGYYRQLPKLRRRAICGISARFRRGMGLCRPQRQPLRSGGPVPLRARLSTRHNR